MTNVRMSQLIASLMPSADYARAERLAAQSGDPLDVVVTRLGLCSEAQLLQAFAGAAGVATVSAAGFPSAPVAEGKLNPLFLRHNRAVPLEECQSARKIDPPNRCGVGLVGGVAAKP